MLAIANVGVQVTLYMADGTAYPLAPLQIPASGVVTVSVNDALASAPPNVSSHVSSWGSAVVSYTYDWQGVILATMSMLDVPRSLQYVYPFTFPNMPQGTGMSGAMAFEGLWWKPTGRAHLFVALRNSTANSVDAAVVLLDPSGVLLSTQQIIVPKQGTAMAEINIPAANAMGGLEVRYDGSMDGLLVAAGIEDDTAGFSANLPMAMPGMAQGGPPQSFQFASVGIMNGQADPMLGFPTSVKFTPYIYLRNVSASPRLVHQSVNWMNGSAPQTNNLDDTTLQPGESRQVLVPPFSGTAPEALNFIYSFDGSSQDIMAATGSADQTGNYVFPVEPHGVGEHGGITSVYWAYGAGLDTMYTIWNPLGVAQEVRLKLVGRDGRLLYNIPVRLAARASTMIDLYELFMSRKLDTAGLMMPPGPMTEKRHHRTNDHRS